MSSDSTHSVHSSHLSLLKIRGRLLWRLRTFFAQEGFLEIEAPTIVCSPGLEPHLDAFEVLTPLASPQAQECEPSAPLPPRRCWLHTSPEYALKRLLGLGLDRIYHLGPCFRDEPPSKTHSPEFTMLEWYMKGANLQGLMTQCERLIQTLAQEVCGDDSLSIKRTLELIDPLELEIDLSRPFERLSVHEAFLRYTKIDLNDHLPPESSADSLREAALRAGLSKHGLHGSWDEIYFQIFMDHIEPQLGRDRPTFLYDFPASQAALARLKPEDPRWALRFELFAGGLELANAFDELSDPIEQRTRFQRDQQIRLELGKPIYVIDEPLLEHLSGLGTCVGIALGFDRLLMLLTGARSISEVRPQDWREP